VPTAILAVGSILLGLEASKARASRDPAGQNSSSLIFFDFKKIVAGRSARMAGKICADRQNLQGRGQFCPPPPRFPTATNAPTA
jgi:hypothetical protein